MLGQASAVTSLGQCAEVSEEDDIRGLYQDLSRPGDEWLGPQRPRELMDLKALIRDEMLYKEEVKSNGKGKGKGEKMEGLRLQLMPARRVCGYSEFLVMRTESKAVGDRPTREEGKDASLLRFLKNTKGMAPLRVALSWVPFMRTTPIPPHVGIMLNDLVDGESERREVDELLASLEAVDGHGCGFGDERRWRDGGEEEECADGFSEEIAKCEMILTRRERAALLARERGVVGDGRGDSEENGDVGDGGRGDSEENGDVDEQSEVDDEAVEAVDTAPAMEGPGSEKRQNEVTGRHELTDDSHPRPAKRARLSVEDLGVGLMPEEDGSFLDFYEQQDEQLQNCIDNTLQDPDIYTEGYILMVDLEVEDDKNDRRVAADYADLSYANTYGDARSSLESVVEPCMYQAVQQNDGPHDNSKRPSEIRFHSSYDLPARHDQDFGTPFDVSGGSQLQEGRFTTDRETVDETFAPNPQPLDVPHSTDHEDDVCQTIDHEHSDRLMIHEKAPLRRLDLDLASHYLRIEAFAQLRAKEITKKCVSSAAGNVKETVNPQDNEQRLGKTPPRTTPPELYDSRTVRIPPHRPQPQTIHKYMASLDLIQKRILVRSLIAQDCLIELVERDSLGGVDLIIDPQTAIIFSSLLSLPAHGKKLLETVSAQSWRYKRILIVFEAYPESRSFRDRKHSKQGRWAPEPQLYAYTPPIVKAIKRFRRDIAIAEGCFKKTTACEVWCAFADSVKEAAMYARLFGDEAEGADWTEGAVWGDREWLDTDPSEDEQSLALLGGMNYFSASIVLYQMTLQQFIDISPEERLAMVGPFVGNEAIAVFNTDIEQRMHAMYEE
ncbi:hypothetical protein C0991_008603 [Blastosporella zonata]|nr:hypothetical protein C0991_008603 [Blastosporella zonata]